MAYTDTLPLADVKTYLKVEHSDTDSEITAMINTACNYIERTTNHILDSRNITYNLGDADCINIWDTPITAVVKGLDKDGADVALVLDTDYSQKLYTKRTQYNNIDRDAIQLVLTVGYASASEVPPGLLDAAKMIVKGLYYSQDAKTIDDAIPLVAKDILNAHKRFVI